MSKDVRIMEIDYKLPYRMELSFLNPSSTQWILDKMAFIKKSLRSLGGGLDPIPVGKKPWNIRRVGKKILFSFTYKYMKAVSFVDVPETLEEN